MDKQIRLFNTLKPDEAFVFFVSFVFYLIIGLIILDIVPWFYRTISENINQVSDSLKANQIAE